MIVYSLTIKHNDEKDSLAGIFVSQEAARQSVDLNWKEGIWYQAKDGAEFLIESWIVQEEKHEG